MLDSFGGAEEGRTPDLRIANAALCQTELLPHGSKEILESGAGWCQAFVIGVWGVRVRRGDGGLLCCGDAFGGDAQSMG